MDENQETRRKFCRNCGKEILFDSKFCEYCGSSQMDQPNTIDPPKSFDGNQNSTVTAIQKNDLSIQESSEKNKFLPYIILSIYAFISFIEICIVGATYEEYRNAEVDVHPSLFIIGTLIITGTTHQFCKSFKQALKYHLFVLVTFFVILVSVMRHDAKFSSETSDSEAPSQENAALTRLQKNAANQAQVYINQTGIGFSHDGLIRQLVIGDQFEISDAKFGVNSLVIDYGEQAAKSAKNYAVSGMNFSCDGLIQQLTVGELFTREEAILGAQKAGICN